MIFCEMIKNVINIIVNFPEIYLSIFQMDVVDPVEVGLEDIVRPAAAASQGVATLAFSHNQVDRK